MELVLDESVGTTLEQKLEGRSVTVDRPPAGVPDQEVLEHAITKEAPLLTRDASDFPKLHRRMYHPGILVDPQMHVRDATLVAETVTAMLRARGEEVENGIWWVSDFFGRF